MPIVTLNADLSVVEDAKISKLYTAKLTELYPFGCKEEDIPEQKTRWGVEPASSKIVEVKDSKMMTYAPLEPVSVSSASANNFLNAVVHAYNNHLSLRISPDDILQCVAMAISTCINDHSEEYRDVFVNHAGKKKLVVKVLTPPGVFNWDQLLDLMSGLIDENVKSSLGLEPSFSTTTRISKSVAALTKMASFKKYFSYGFMMCCGIRAVDLTGTLDDWLMLRQKVGYATGLMTSKGHMVNWSKHVFALIDRLIETYRVGDGVLSDDLKTFWSRIVTYVPYGSGGERYISGWIKLLVPGDQYDRFPEKCNLLDVHSSEPERTRDYYGWQDLMKAWAGMTFDAPKSHTFVEAELNDHGLVYDLYCVSGFVGMQIVDGFVQPQLGYAVHATKKDAPDTTAEAEAEARGLSELTRQNAALRGTQEYSDAQDANMDVIRKVQGVSDS